MIKVKNIGKLQVEMAMSDLDTVPCYVDFDCNGCDIIATVNMCGWGKSNMVLKKDATRNEIKDVVRKMAWC